MSSTDPKSASVSATPGGAPAVMPSAERIVPAFHEHFLFDDELEATDDSFMRRYNLAAADDDFPLLLKPQETQSVSPHPGRPSPIAPQLSTFSSALDLASLSHMNKRPTHDSMALSPWLHAERLQTPSRDSLSVTSAPPAATAAAAASLLLPHDTPTASMAASFAPAVPDLSMDARSMHGTSPLVSSLPSLGTMGCRVPEPDASRMNGRRAERKRTRAVDEVPRSMRRSDVDLASMQLDELRGDIAQLCRDQFGCRFLQRKLDERIPAQCDLIFAETFPYFAELMTDPFGNYLCQKLLEHCTNAQRDLIVESIGDDLVSISLNMHGTRAVQKTIDFLSTRTQTLVIIQAFAEHVVELIKDLNGNHVIQKCLHRLDAQDNQFIYDSVAAHCVDVATHRHGCCVLQRCIDHASHAQRLQLVREITMYSLTLVQDPFGNYVVQYVLDLNEPAFTAAITHEFLGHVYQLSTQKFSSNVMEKCLRVAEPSMRHKLVAELLDAHRLELLLRDSFANYVVQTCLDYAEPAQRAQLIECIRPILPSIRHTPYGKRIQSKLQRGTNDEPKSRRESRQQGAYRAPASRPARRSEPVGHEEMVSALDRMHLGTYAAPSGDMALATAATQRPW